MTNITQEDLEALVAHADRLARKNNELELELEAANHRETNYIRQVARLKDNTELLSALAKYWKINGPTNLSE